MEVDEEQQEDVGRCCNMFIQHVACSYMLHARNHKKMQLHVTCATYRYMSHVLHATYMLRVLYVIMPAL